MREDRERAFDARPAAGRQRPQDRAATRTPRAPSATRRHDVEPAPDSAVDPDLGPAADGGDDLLEHVRGRDDAIELTRAMVRDDDPRDPVLDRQRGRPRAVTIPLRNTGSDVQLRIVAMSRHVRPWSRSLSMIR